MIKLKLVIALTLVAPGGWLIAQQTAPANALPGKNGKAAISGVVVDRLNGRYLGGADVIIEGANAVTDSVGRFRFDGLSPGTYQVVVSHPLLDTLGMSLASRPFHIGPDSTSTVTLSVPPAATIISGVCPPQVAGHDNSAVIGRVDDPETLQPVAGAEVSVAWMEIEVSKELGIRQTPHVLRDSTNAMGVFHLCGLPNSMDATLQARKGTAATSEVPISLGPADPALFARSLLLSVANSGAKAGTATISGRVVLEGNAPSVGSRVELVGTDFVALTNENGEFTMTKLPSGSRVLLARHLGYAAQTAPVDLTPREQRKVTITLPKFIGLMDPVIVMARRNAGLDHVGFTHRKRSENGYFFGPEQIQRMHAIYLTDILRHVPGIHVTSSAMGSQVRSSRGRGGFGGSDCIQYVIDGMPWRFGDISSFVMGYEVVAAEVYQSASVPAQYMTGASNCVTIVLWTRFRIRDLSDK